MCYGYYVLISIFDMNNNRKRKHHKITYTMQFLSRQITQMTHTLHPEIEKRIKSCAKNIVWLKEYPLEDGCVEIIKFHLLPYLNLPQPIENEPLPEKDDEFVKQFVEDAEHEIIEKHFEAEFLDWEPVVEWRSMLEAKSILHYIKENYVFKEEQKQSTPQIEKIELILDWTRPTNTLLTDANMSRIDTMLSQIIDYINNTLPPTKSNDQ